MSAPDPARAAVEWRRLHKVTPLLNAWKVAAALLAIFVWQYSDTIGQLELPGGTLLLVIVGAIVVGTLIGLGYSALAWSRTRYGVGEGSIFLHSGILFRQQRHVRLDRLQTVDVTQPLLARLFGFASLKIEAAGGSGSNLTLSFLTEAEAQRLRNELLARAAGVAFEEVPDGGAPVPVPEAPQREVLSLSPGRLVGSLALSFGVMLVVLAAVGLVVTAVIAGSVAPILGLGPAVIGAALYAWGRFAGEFSFRVAVSADGIRIRHGLLETKSRTVPPGRVQAVQLTQPLLWRIKGWWRLQVNIAGYGAEETSGTVLYPAATSDEVGHILYLVLPDLGDDRPLEVLAAGMTGSGPGEGFVTSPRRARALDWFTWQRTGFRVTETAILLRTGRWWRRMVIVPHARTQSLGLTQGPIERRLGLANFALHSTPGPVTPQVYHLDAHVARALLNEQADRARRARRVAGPERWMLPRPADAGSEAATASGSTPAPASGSAPDHAPVPPVAGSAAFGGVLPSRPAPDSYGGVLPSRPAPQPPGWPGRHGGPTPHSPDPGGHGGTPPQEPTGPPTTLMHERDH